ncbi:MAG: efflux RND transporter permease subunit [Myxococcota bacterium]|nr:efflux RND transporter permease subunit [Myxococcota bacterium]
MNLTRAAIQRDRVTWVALAVIALTGVFTYLGMPRAEDPGFTVRTAVVLTRFPGASAERVEQLVTDKLEKKIQELPELERIQSQSKEGVSIIYVDIDEKYSNMRPLWDKLRRKVQRAAAELPSGVIGPVVNDEFGDVFGIVLGIIGDGFGYAELKQVADEVRDELLHLPDVAKVEIYGAQQERIFVEYDNARLAELGLSPLLLQKVLRERNIIVPGGQVSTEFERITLEPSGNFESIEDTARTVVVVPGSREVMYLGDIVDIYRGYVDPPHSKVRVSGENALALAVAMREGGNILDVGKGIEAFLERARSVYPIGIEFEMIQFQPDAVERKISDFIGNLLQAIGVVTLVLLFALGLRTGLIVASLIPMTIAMGLVLMGYFDIGLNQISLAALIIALGMLVDTSIVMCESITVEIAAGKSPVEAAVASSQELMVPLLTSALTTAAAFLPIYLAEAKAGEYTAPIFQVVTIMLLSSWLLGLTLIPLLCVRYLRVSANPDAESVDSPFYQRYRAVLVGVLQHRFLFLVAVAGVFAAAIYGFRFVPSIFFPPNDRPTFTAEIELPAGSPIARTEAVVREFDRYIAEHHRIGPERDEGVTDWITFVGNGGPRFILPYAPKVASPEIAYAILNATSRSAVDPLLPKIEQFLRDHFPDVKATVRPLDTGPPAWPPIEVRISGRDTEQIFALADQVKARLREIPGTKLIDDDWGARAKKARIAIDQPRARRAGVTSQDVALSLQSFLSGIETTQYREGDKLIPVTLRSVAAGRNDLGRIDGINVYAQASGVSVPLNQVADLVLEWEPARVHRFNRVRTVTVESAMAPSHTAADINSALSPWLEEQSTAWGLGYTWELGGEHEASDRSRRAIGAKLPIAGLIIVLLLVGQFNSVRKPLIILITIPLGLIGVVFGLLVARSYFGFFTLLGVIALSGVVINNAIVLIDRIRIEIEDLGRTPAEAVIEAAIRRLRPILLTTATTVLGLIPLWFGGGSMFQPMAITIIFGLLFATVLTLLLVPVLYSLLFRVDVRAYSAPPTGENRLEPALGAEATGVDS